MGKLWGALLKAFSLISASLAGAYVARLYPEQSPAAVGALITIHGAALFSLATLFQRQEKKRAAKVRWDRTYWKWAVILAVPALIQGQLNQEAQARVGVGTVMTITTLGAVGLATWRLVFPERGPCRRRHTVWFLVGLAGVVMLTGPFSDGVEPWGLVAAGVVSAFGVSDTIASAKLTELGDLTRVIELMRWASVFLVAIPVLIWTDGRWMTGQVLSTVLVTSVLIVAANKLGIHAFRLARSDGVISTVACLTPVVACLAGLLVGTGQAPGVYGWLGAGLVVSASAATLWILHVRSGHAGPPVVKDGVWKHRRFGADRNSDAWIAGPGSGIGLPSSFKAADWGVWKHHLA
ncbi:hypothetical protein GCM10010191_10660 [Actinomadura vinacea]|uniref:DMT family transporter n=1 Tax=Actinomadura vinacea TaxID=115336 RepID=A0ABN3IH92_9ACTN